MTYQAGRGLARAAISVLLSMAMLAAGCWPAQAAPLVPADGYGFGQGAAPEIYSFDDTNRELDAVTQTGASWLRVLVDWGKIEPSQGQFDWSYLDNVVNSARARNLKVLAVLAYTPLWARLEGPNILFFTAPPNDPATFAQFSAAVVQRYSDRISNWEIWNEPNLPLFFGLADKAPVRYTALLKAAYPAIKGVQPGATVVAAGLSPMAGDAGPPAFLTAMYAAGAEGYFDAANMHPYVNPGGLAADSNNGWSDVARVHQIMVDHGDGGKKIWMTEVGAPTSDTPDGVSQQEQAHEITDVLAAAARTGYSGPAFVYSIRDVDTTARGSVEANYGTLLTSDWQPKFSAGVLAR
jgi:hypothetical protein